MIMITMSTTIDIEEAVAHLSTIGDWIRWAASRFTEAGLYFGHGADNAWDEAVQLVLTTLRLPLDMNAAIADATLTPSERKQIANLILRRIETRQPLAYLLKQGWFNGLPFYVDERVLVPRSPMAELLDKQFEPWVDAENVQHILDIGTGSGCIAIAAALMFPEAQVDAVDINPDALVVAKINVERYHLQDRVHLHQGDCFSGWPAKKYDIILSNPPYVSAAEMATLPQEYHREPRAALYAPDDGLAIVKRILAEAKRHLTPQGILVVEVGNSDEALVEHFPNTPFTWLDLERGGHGLFLLTAEQLDK